MRKNSQEVPQWLRILDAKSVDDGSSAPVEGRISRYAIEYYLADPNTGKSCDAHPDNQIVLVKFGLAGGRDLIAYAFCDDLEELH